MINPNFYVDYNKVRRFSFSKLMHYPLKPLSIAVGNTVHIVEEGQDLFSIAKIYFGEYGERYWTTIADLNQMVFPNNVLAGQEIKIPNLVAEAKVDKKIIYEDNISTSIKI